ncbi:MAG: hypothetical protein QXX97_02945 [Nitrososphaerota archaeon]
MNLLENLLKWFIKYMSKPNINTALNNIIKYLNQYQYWKNINFDD